MEQGVISGLARQPLALLRADQGEPGQNEGHPSLLLLLESVQLAKDGQACEKLLLGPRQVPLLKEEVPDLAQRKTESEGIFPGHLAGQDEGPLEQVPRLAAVPLLLAKVSEGQRVVHRPEG